MDLDEHAPRFGMVTHAGRLLRSSGWGLSLIKCHDKARQALPIEVRLRTALTE